VEAQAAGLPCIVSDGVPVECAKTDLVKHISLSAGTTKWAEEILKMQHIFRRNTKDQIVQAGYDIEANAQWLQGFYLGE
jgi:hypothetical protein